MSSANKDNNEYFNYMVDLCNLMIEGALKAKQDYQNNKADDFLKGYLMAYHDVISLMQSQAQAFDIPLEKIKLNTIEPLKDLLSITKSNI